MKINSALSAIDFYSKDTLPKLHSLIEEDESEQQKICTYFTKFIEENKNCFESNHDFSLLPKGSVFGHCTGSAIIVNPDLSKIVLTFHKKLNKWLQLGGHADGHHKLEEVALREGYEESGLSLLNIVNVKTDDSETLIPLLFDLDIHDIPENPKTDAHMHYDARYLIVSELDHLKMSEESLDLGWFSIAEARKLTDEPSMLRIFNKLQAISKKYKISMNDNFVLPI